MPAAGSEVPIEYAPKRAGEIQRSCLNVDKVQQELGWRPQVAIADGLQRTFEWASGRQAAEARA